MKKASIRDLHIRTSELVRQAAEGSVIIIERRGEPVAELRPIAAKKHVGLPDMSDLLSRTPSTPFDFATEAISEDRDR
jgi:prevent-host-death family protein